MCGFVGVCVCGCVSLWVCGRCFGCEWRGGGGGGGGGGGRGYLMKLSLSHLSP